MLGLVYFNYIDKKAGAEKKAKTRISRKGKKADGVTDATVVEDAPKAEAKEKKEIVKKAPKNLKK